MPISSAYGSALVSPIATYVGFDLSSDATAWTESSLLKGRDPK